MQNRWRQGRKEKKGKCKQHFFFLFLVSGPNPLNSPLFPLYPHYFPHTCHTEHLPQLLPNPTNRSPQFARHHFVFPEILILFLLGTNVIIYTHQNCPAKYLSNLFALEEIFKLPTQLSNIPYNLVCGKIWRVCTTYLLFFSLPYFKREMRP